MVDADTTPGTPREVNSDSENAGEMKRYNITLQMFPNRDPILIRNPNQCRIQLRIVHQCRQQDNNNNNENDSQSVAVQEGGGRVNEVNEKAYGEPIYCFLGHNEVFKLHPKSSDSSYPVVIQTFHYQSLSPLHITYPDFDVEPVPQTMTDTETTETTAKDGADEQSTSNPANPDDATTFSSTEPSDKKEQNDDVKTESKETGRGKFDTAMMVVVFMTLLLFLRELARIIGLLNSDTCPAESLGFSSWLPFSSSSSTSVNLNSNLNSNNI